MKEKIAISIDKSILDKIDNKIDNSIIRSRSQAIEYFLMKGLKEESIDAAVILIKGSQQEILLKQIKGTSLIKHHLSFFSSFGIKNCFIVTQHTKNTNLLLNEISNSSINVQIIETESKGNAQALLSLKEKLPANFICMSGDVYNNFDLAKMIKKHLDSDKLATMGLMSSDETSDYGTAVLDGDLIVDFEEKPKKAASHIVNAGIYIFKKEFFELIKSSLSLEKDLFPQIAKLKQLIGFFTHGEYQHLG